MCCAAWRSREKEQAVSIEVHHLNVWYGRSQALYDINLSFESLGATAIIGPSGCGKSTFVRCLNRMHEETEGGRVEGEVLIDGVNIYARSIQPMYVRRHIGMVFQRPNPIPTLSIFENVALGPRLNGMARGGALKEIVERSLAQAALWNEVKDRLGESAAATVGWAAAATVYRARAGHRTARAADGRTVLRARPHLDLSGRGTHQPAQKRLPGHRRDAQYAAGGAYRRQTAFFLQGKLIEVGETTAFFSRPAQKETEDYITGRFS